MSFKDGITVKNVAGTDVVYAGKVASAGDQSAAKYEQESYSTVPSRRPYVTVKSGNSGDNKIGLGRRLDVNCAWPITATDSSGAVRVIKYLPLKAWCVIPQDIDQSLIDEAVTQFTGVVASAIIRESMKSGYAPRDSA